MSLATSEFKKILNDYKKKADELNSKLKANPKDVNKYGKELDGWTNKAYRDLLDITNNLQREMKTYYDSITDYHSEVNKDFLHIYYLEQKKKIEEKFKGKDSAPSKTIDEAVKKLEDK